ncbi:hypothetical protein KL928_001338 [Ogataea angusta]|uniref:Uncharacterized protein n=1 Tax=Pichia angusta TaxID=870730 RepID=A0AAN6DJ78_PICAN|nr:uncharacterized protein KL928_001338 [Ogataea angusta]KAG7821254.1 hypothetical protein KL928_001338 [Ogataea angusta]KAG7851665.1 hypothetical protein KL941_001334 [Ogataea angusta]
MESHEGRRQRRQLAHGEARAARVQPVVAADPQIQEIHPAPRERRVARRERLEPVLERAFSVRRGAVGDGVQSRGRRAGRQAAAGQKVWPGPAHLDFNKFGDESGESQGQCQGKARNAGQVDHALFLLMRGSGT